MGTHANRSSVSIEPLEPRQHLTVVNELENPGSPGERLTTGDVNRILAAAASQAMSTQIIAVVDRENEILGVWAGVDARLSTPPDQNGNPNNILINPVVKAITRARTAAFFESRGDAFSTRTARFIIQDNFPFPVPNTPGGPLYGVQFSTLPFSDFSFNSLGAMTAPSVSGDPGGIALFKNGEPVGGIGVSGDGRDFLARADLPYDPRVSLRRDANGNLTRDDTGKKLKLIFDGIEENDFDEAVAKAGAAAAAPGGGSYEAPFDIQAERIFVAGLRFPYDADQPAAGNALQSIPQLIAAGRGNLINPQQAVTVGGEAITVTNPNDPTGGTKVPLFRDARSTRGSPTPNYPTASFGGIDGQLKNQNTSFDTNGDGVVDGNDSTSDAFGFIPGGVNPTQPVPSAAFAGDDTNEDGVADSNDPQLNVSEVKRIITNAVAQSLITRAAIRQPLGVPARVHIAVVDRSGTTLGAFRMDDGTNFSYDVAVQKARTAAFFSDNNHALTPRSLGFVSQAFFPLASTKNLGGPLFHLQNVLSLGILNVLNGGTPAGFAFPKISAANPLANGITIFPGGAPLYKNGVLVGAIGVSGDGVDQDDIKAFAGTRGFRLEGAAIQRRVDFLDENDLVSHLRQRVSSMFMLYNLESDLYPDATESRLLRNLGRGLDGVRLPYVKFPRNPDV